MKTKCFHAFLCAYFFGTETEILRNQNRSSNGISPEKTTLKKTLKTLAVIAFISTLTIMSSCTKDDSNNNGTSDDNYLLIQCAGLNIHRTGDYCSSIKMLMSMVPRNHAHEFFVG